ncbi:MAG: sigma-70 family RNA polymerase sigma factor [Planctomycetes bacterium]|nr:sigma-70 family RNA polymerase sigma factor [Planctomycetota bacterium]
MEPLSDHPDTLVLRDLAWVRTLARRLLGDPDLADDVAQETWLEARTAPPRRLDGGLRGWLATVVRHRAQKLRRGEARRQARERAVAAAAPTATGDSVVERAALHRELMTAVMDLDEPLRTTVLLRHLDGLSTEDVAARQGITAVAARKRLSRALQLLRQRLDRGHAGGFVAWSVAWRSHLGIAPAGGGSLLAWCLVVGMQAKWWAALAALVALSLWWWWPRPAPSVAPVAVLEPGPAAGAPVDAPPPIPAAGRTALATAAIEVVDELGRPRAGVTVLALAGGALRQQVASDATGRAEFASVDHDEWLCAAPGMVPLRAPRTAAAPQRIVYPLGLVVAGTAVPPAGTGAAVELRLEHDRPSPWAAGLDAAALAVLAALGVKERELLLRLDAERQFRFAGLAADWSGALTTDGAWTLRETSGLGHADGATAVLLLEPVADLRLELGAPFVVRGRLLAAGVPTAGIDVVVVAPDLAIGSAPRQAQSDGDGRFAVTVPRPAPDAPWRGELLVGTDGDDFAQRRVEAAGGRPEIDVGEIEIGRTLAFRVRGADGAPLVGARVHVVGNGRAFTSGSTDVAGNARLCGVPADAAWATVRAHGHRLARVALPAAGEVAVQLDRGNGIDVTVRTRGGELAADLRVRVEAERLPFDAGTGPGPLQPFVQAFPLDRAGRLELGDLAPGLLLRIVAIDETGHELASSSVVAPPLGRIDSLELVVDAAQFHVTGTVRDAAGRPVARARVYAEQDGQALTARSDGDGRFRLGPLRAPLAAAHVEIVHPAFPTWLRNDQVLGPDAPLDVVLEGSRTVRAWLRQPDGAPLPAGRVEAWIAFDGAATVLGRVETAGEVRFERAAARPGRLTVRFGGREWQQPIAATATDVEVALPAVGQLHATCDRSQLEAGERIAVVVTPLEPAGEPDRQYLPGEVDPTAPAFVLLLAEGRYRIAGEARRFGGGRPRVRAFGAPREIEVTAGGVVQLSLP